MGSDGSSFVDHGDNGGRLTRRRVVKGSLAAFAGGSVVTTAPLATVWAQSATPGGSAFGGEQRMAAERILQREIDSGNVPGIGWSIGNAKETLAEGAVGLRVVAPAAAMNAATRCALASVSKQFTAACVFILRDEGKLSLDAPLADHIPSYRYANRMTLRQVLTMSSGISSDTDTCEAAVGERIDDAAMLENLNRMELEFPPGTHFAYSNCAYDVAGAVVAKLSGMTFASFVEDRILKPLGMSSTFQLGTRSDTDFAEGYSPEGKGWKAEPVSVADKTFASGNLASNPSDMQRWNRALLNATVLPKKSLDEMFTVNPLSSGAKMNYASGWFVDPGGPIWHGGALAGYGTANVLVPATGHAITLLGNTAPGEQWKPWEVARQIYNAAELGPPLPPLAPIVRTTVPK